MPNTPEGIFYANNSTEMSVADITAAMATSIDEQISIVKQGGIVASDAARDALYPVPVQGNSVFRSDLGNRQTYFALYNSSTNPGGKPAAGWYNERVPFVQQTQPVNPINNDLWFW